jgi:hypothetical protein
MGVALAFPPQRPDKHLPKNNTGNLQVLPFGLDYNILAGRNLSVRRIGYGNGGSKSGEW